MNYGAVVSTTIKEKTNYKVGKSQTQCRSKDTVKSWGDANFKVTWFENRSRGTEFAYAIGGVWCHVVPT